MLYGPLIVLLHEQFADETNDGFNVVTYADNLGAGFDLADRGVDI